MCLIGVKETYVQGEKKVTKNFLGQTCTTVSGLKGVLSGAFSHLSSKFLCVLHMYCHVRSALAV